MKASMMGDVHSGNGDQGTLTDIKRYSSRKLEDSEGHKIRGQPRNLNIPQGVLSSAAQVFELHICDLDIIEVDLDCFGRALRPVEDESDSRCSFSFSHVRERGEVERDPGSMYELPFFVVARRFVPKIKIGLGFVCV